MAEFEGFIPISRKIFEHPFWKEKREFSRFEAWVDILQTARFEPTETRKIIGNKFVTWGRGELVASLRFLAERWGWGKNKVDNYLKILANEAMIEKRTDEGTGQTIIKVCNYGNYNALREHKGRPTGQQRDSNGTATGQQRDKTNKENNDNNIIEVVEVSSAEKKFLIEEFCQTQQAVQEEKEKNSAKKEKAYPSYLEAIQKISEMACWRICIEHYKISEADRELMFKKFYELKEDNYKIRYPTAKDMAENFYYWIKFEINNNPVKQLQAQADGQVKNKPRSKVAAAVQSMQEAKLIKRN